jgi:transcriptional regulator with XRE-family HTH domain
MIGRSIETWVPSSTLGDVPIVRPIRGTHGLELPVKRPCSADLFTVAGMSSRTPALDVADRLAGHIGITIAESRRRRSWTLRELARRASVSPSMVHAIEHGAPASLGTYSAIALALGLEPRLDMADPRRRTNAARAEDPVHAVMGECLAARLSGHGFAVAIDEPYQHYQFAGRADLLAWDLASRSLLHIENRTRFPNLQDAIGSYNAKRRYFPAVLADRLGLRNGFASVTNVMAGLWSGEVVHMARIRAASFNAVCPDDPSAFERWWNGRTPQPGASTSTFILLDPDRTLSSRRRAFASLSAALDPALRPRYRGYAEAASALGT